MSEKLLKTVKAALPVCNRLPEGVKDILNTLNNSLSDLDESASKQLWILVGEFIKDTSVLEDAVDDKELLVSYQCILNLVQYAINSAEDIISVYDKDEHLLKTIMLFQSLYTKQFKFKFKLEIAKMCSSFWKLLAASTQNKPDLTGFDTIMTQNFIFTFEYLFNTIKKTTKKLDMKTLSTLLWELCKIVSTLSSDQSLMNMIVSNLGNIMKKTLFLETETGKLAIADIFTINPQLFLKFHQIVKQLLSKVNTLEAEAFGEIYFIAWINSNSSMKEVIEQEGIFDLISKTMVLSRKGLTLRLYRNALILLKSMQNHRKHLMFSKVITNLYTPVLWRNLRSEIRMVRCNSIEMLTRAYPLEKRGQGREVSSRFLIKQQNAFLDQLEDSCPQVRVAAIKGVCCCLRYFWHTFEEEQIIKCFNLFLQLMNESVFEVRREIFYGFCQLLDENKSHNYFLNSTLIANMKRILKDNNEKVRRALFHFLLKVKKTDSQNTTTEKINFAKIVNLQDIAKALSYECKQNGLLLVELIIDNFIGDKISDGNTTVTRLKVFYKLNPTACRKLMLYSEKVLDFDSACKHILLFLNALKYALLKKEKLLKDKEKDKDKENEIPAKKRKLHNNSGSGTSEISSSSSNSSTSDHEDKEYNFMCCFLDCVHCLVILHYNKLNDGNNHEQKELIENSCIKCLTKIMKFFKNSLVYFHAMSLASWIPVAKISSHITAPSVAISKLKKLPEEVVQAEEEINKPEIDCLVFTLCKWKRGHEILELVMIWLDETFETLNLNGMQYSKPNTINKKRVTFDSSIEKCKPMTGVMLIRLMLTNIETQCTLFSSDVNKNCVYELIICMQRVKSAIEYRIHSDDVLNCLLSDELLTELFELHLKLHIFYYDCGKNGVDKIIKYQTSIFDWVMNHILASDLHHKNENTIKLAANTINVVNSIVKNCFSMGIRNNTFFHHFCTFCKTLLHNFLGPRVIMSIIAALAIISHHFSYLKLVDELEDDTSQLTNCVCSIISILGESNFNEDRFISIIGDPKFFRSLLIMVIFEIHKINTVESKQIFMSFIETIINIIASKNREIDDVHLSEHLQDLPFGAYQLANVILNSAHLKYNFLSIAFEIFSSDIYKNDCDLLLSAISFMYTLSFQINRLRGCNFEPVVQLLYKILTDNHKTTTLLGNNCTTRVEQGVSILETSDFNNRIMDFKRKGHNALTIIAKQLHITVTQ